MIFIIMKYKECPNFLFKFSDLWNAPENYDLYVIKDVKIGQFIIYPIIWWITSSFSPLFLFIRLWLVVWLQKHAYIENRGSEFLVENAMLTIEEMWHKNNNPFSILSFFHKFYFSKHQHKGRTMVDLIKYWCIEMFHINKFTIITRQHF